MASSTTFFQEPRVYTKPSARSSNYFHSEPVKPIVKKIDKDDQATKLVRWLKLIPAVIVIALGSALLPHFGLACAISVGVLLTNLVTASIISIFVKSKLKKEYLDCLKNKQLVVTLGGPILEELIFRGAILQLSLLLLGLAFPGALLLPCLNLGISVVAATAVLISSCLFGLAHASNAEKDNYAQVATTFFAGLFFGFLALQYGLLVAIGAHVLNNTIVAVVLNLSLPTESAKENKVKEEAIQPKMM